MAATVRAVFEIGFAANFGSKQIDCSRRTRKHRHHRSGEPGRPSGKASRLRPGSRRQRRQAITELPVSAVAGWRARSSDRKPPPDASRMPVRAPVTEPAGRSSDRDQRQRHWAPSVSLRRGPRAGESGVDLRVGPICIGAGPARSRRSFVRSPSSPLNCFDRGSSASVAQLHHPFRLPATRAGRHGTATTL